MDSQRTIQTLEDMLRACVLELKGSWDDHLPLMSSLRGRSPVRWFEVGEVALLGPDLVMEALEKVRMIREVKTPKAKSPAPVK
ncbi:hypothetical protein H5410_064414 [Solanum commersonii]|uniref:Uncharacterized protein n=1 Tax=Solanum commersonii TaxID=4109 RepID=A0A9J5VZD5_SOLCO|nr:hypothetical protein H5410_064414 [Solanum commersonii]